MGIDSVIEWLLNCYINSKWNRAKESCGRAICTIYSAPTIIKGIIRLFIWGPRGQGARDSIRNINAPLPLLFLRLRPPALSLE